MQLNFTAELAQLLAFAGDTACAIRMYSAYSSGGPSSVLNIPPDPEREAIDLMFLADSLHHFGAVGRTLQDGVPARIIEVCDGVLGAFTHYDAERPEFGRRQGKHTFELWQTLGVDLNAARAAITGIRDKAAAMLAVA